MIVTITDSTLLAALTKSGTVVDVHGPNGEFVGTFSPPVGALPPGFKLPFTEEEIERRRLERTGRPLADILRDLEARAS